MNVFKIFATMSLVDAISKPLAFIQKGLKSTDKSMTGLSARLGKLATGFGKMAVPSAIFLASLGAMTGEAIAFESKMADVAKVTKFESPAELQEMSLALQDLSLQIPIAAEGFADIAAAASQSGVAKNDLIDFSVQAAKMGVAFNVAAGDASKTMANWRSSMGLSLKETYALADAVNHLGNNMNATADDISQVLNKAGAVGKSVGLSEQQVSALAATILSAGAEAGAAGTGLNNLFTSLADGASMSKDAAAAFKSMGFDIKSLGAQMQADGQGTIMQVMEGIASLSKDKQISAIKAIFGDLGVKNIAPMVGNLDNLRDAFSLVGDAANYAGSMQAEYDARSATTENSIQLLKNSFNVLSITIGSMFLPVIDAAAKGFGFLMRGLIAVTRTPAGSFIIKLAAGIAAATVGVTGLVVAFALLKPIILIVGGAFSAILWPVLAIAGVVALMAAAWKSDFMGIATTVTGFVNKIKLTFQGVSEIFKSLKDGKGELSGELAEKIEAAGLMGLVTTVSKVLYRVLNFFKGVGAGISEGFGEALEGLRPCFEVLGEAIAPIIGLFRNLVKSGEEAPTAQWASFGKTIGSIVVVPIKILASVLGVVIRFFAGIVRGATKAASGLGGRLAPAFTRIKTVLEPVINFFGNLIGKFFGTGDSAATAAGQTGEDKWLALGEAIGGKLIGALEWLINMTATVLEKLSAMGSAVGEAIAGIKTAISNFDLFESGTALIDTFIGGIKAGAETLVSAVSGVLSRVRNLLPFSDAKEGPFSNLTASGMAFVSTFAAGIKNKAAELVDTVSGMLGQVRNFFTSSDAKVGPLSDLTASGRALPVTYAKGVTAGSPALLAATDAMMGGINMAPPYFEMPGMSFGGAGFSGGNIPAPGFSLPDGGEAQAAFKSRFAQGNSKTINIHIDKVELPGVTDADGFVAALEAIAEERS